MAAHTNSNSVDDMNEQLIKAARRGEEEDVRRLLKEGADVNAVDAGGMMPLHEACWYGHSDVVHLLLQQGADTNAVDALGTTPLQRTCANGHTDVVHLLLKEGADVNAFDDCGWMLHQACTKGHTDVVALLLQQGADVNAVYGPGWTPLHKACRYGRADAVRLLLLRGADVNAVGKDGSTPLHRACFTSVENIIVVRMLIDEGSNINAVNDEGRTPLDEATSKVNSSSAAQLLQDVQGAVQKLSDLCTDDGSFDFEQYFSSDQASGYRLTEKRVEASDELRTSRAYKQYTFEKARKRLRSQKIKLFANGQVREDGTIFPLTSADIEALVRAYAVVGRDMFASKIPGCVQINYSPPE